MAESFGTEANIALDKIIAARRTIRKFKNDVPPVADIEKVIKAGILAPFAGMSGIPLSETRRFVVLKKNSETLEKAQALMKTEMQRNYGKLKLLSKIVPYLRKNAGPFVKILENFSRNGLPVFKTAPYYIVVGERKGFPPAEKSSLAHVMQNMWLKATALGFGFQLVSATQTMEKNKDFMKLLGIPCGEFAIDGCAIGYADQTPEERPEISADNLTSWI